MAQQLQEQQGRSPGPGTPTFLATGRRTLGAQVLTSPVAGTPPGRLQQALAPHNVTPGLRSAAPTANPPPPPTALRGAAPAMQADPVGSDVSFLLPQQSPSAARSAYSAFSRFQLARQPSGSSFQTPRMGRQLAAPRQLAALKVDSTSAQVNVGAVVPQAAAATGSGTAAAAQAFPTGATAAAASAAFRPLASTAEPQAAARLQRLSPWTAARAHPRGQQQQSPLQTPARQAPMRHSPSLGGPMAQGAGACCCPCCTSTRRVAFQTIEFLYLGPLWF